MPEYLAPDVYVEEVSFRSKSIEGVPTSTTGFAGMTHFGPVHYEDPRKREPLKCEPRLITSFTEFERVYGGLDPLRIDVGGSVEERIPYLAHAARAFFMNGGKRLYVSRVFLPRGVGNGIATFPIAIGDTGTATWRARWPGESGNVLVTVKPVRSKNVAYDEGSGVQARRARHGAVVEVTEPGVAAPDDDDPLDASNLRVVEVDDAGVQSFVKIGGFVTPLTPGSVIRLVELTVAVQVNAERIDETGQLGTHARQKRVITRIFDRDDPEHEDSVVWLDWEAPDAAPAERFLPALAMIALTAAGSVRLAGGDDGAEATPDALRGEGAHPDDATVKAKGLEALGEIDDIAIVALPDAGGLTGDPSYPSQAADRLLGHAERQRFRIAIVDAPPRQSLTEIRDFRGRIDSKYGALYHPWIEVLDPTERAAQGAPPRRLLLPPSGFVAGIYARSDIERGVHKAPANEVVRGLTRFELNINKERQAVLNPEGINALRFFEGRGNRVWGARTLSSDPEWKYVNVRRLFIHVEHSIYNGTQWAVFEPNNRRLWANVRQTVEDFLLVLWKDGALMGDKPDEAYFVRCDRTTMTQNDLDNGRLICLVGIAPTKPAEFVIFRIGQWTADAAI